MHTVYILKSLTTGRYYVGKTENLDRRLIEHNQGKSRSTKKELPWKVVYKEVCSDGSHAWHREKQIKSYKGGEAFKALIQNSGEVA